jgi:hypothetical protein
MIVLSAIILTIVVVFTTTAFHYEAIRWLDRLARLPRYRYRPVVVGTFAGLITIHVAEILLYAGVYALAAGPLGLGMFRGERQMTPFDFFYYAAETYSSLGYGDIYPVGAIRLIASISPLNGMLLLAWSGAFLFSRVENWRLHDDRSSGRRPE